jgi:spore coat polysaccharide biosynthesis protein SpsF
MKYIAIVQARMGSTRLPGKVLLPLEGKPILDRIVERIGRVSRICGLVVATSVSISDDAIWDWAIERGVDCFRGSEENVLDRFHRASLAYPSDAYVRATGDNPLIDPGVVDGLLDFFETRRLSYSGSTGFPLGTSAEVFTSLALEEAFLHAREPYETEHVTPCMYRRMENWAQYVNDENLSAVRLTVDTPEDYALVSAVFAHFKERVDDFGYRDVLGYLKLHPDVAGLNAGIRQKKLGE